MKIDLELYKYIKENKIPVPFTVWKQVLEQCHGNPVLAYQYLRHYNSAVNFKSSFEELHQAEYAIARKAVWEEEKRSENKYQCLMEAQVTETGRCLETYLIMEGTLDECINALVGITRALGFTGYNTEFHSDTHATLENKDTGRTALIYVQGGDINEEN